MDEPVKKYRYELNGVGIPSVTEIIGEVLGSGYGNFPIDPWYMERGVAIHACAAFIAAKKEFTFDPQLAPQVGAIHAFFEAYQPEVISYEDRTISERYRFGGTLDLLIKLKGKKVIVDYKGAALPKTINIQLGGYGELKNVNLGMAVMLKPDGTFKATKIVDLKLYRRQFLACLTVHNLRRNL